MGNLLSPFAKTRSGVVATECFEAKAIGAPRGGGRSMNIKQAGTLFASKKFRCFKNARRIKLIAQKTVKELQNAALANRIQVIEVLLESLKQDIPFVENSAEMISTFKVKTFDLGRT